MKLNTEDLDSLDSIIQDFKDQGLKCMVYAKKELDQKQAEQFSKTIHNLKYSLMSQKKELESLATMMEVRLDMLGVIGLKEEIKEEAIELVNFFNSLNMHVWLLSGDNFENTLNAGLATNIINAKKDSFLITDTNPEDLFLAIRNILSEVKLIIDPYKKNEDFLKASIRKEKISISQKRILKRMTTSTHHRFAITQDVQNLLNEKYLVLNGDSLKTIFQDEYLKWHFIFLLSLMKNVIGYNLNPEHKGQLVKIIQE